MPTVEEIEDESYRRYVNEKAGAAGDDEADWDDESDLSDYSSDDGDEVSERGLTRVGDETIFQRIAALRDIVSPSTRQAIARRVKQVTSYGGTAFLWGGRAAWVLTTTTLLVGLPYMLAVEDEARVMQQERDLSAQQQGAQQMMGARQPGQDNPGGAGAPSSQGIRPPGF